MGGEIGGGGLSKVLQIKPKLGGRHIACAALALDGRYIAVSTSLHTKVFRLGRRARPVRSISLPSNCAPASNAIIFSPDGGRLILAAAAGDIRIVSLGKKNDLGDSGVKLVHCFKEHVDGVGVEWKDEGAVPVVAMCISACGRWLASRSLTGVVHVFDLLTLEHHWTLPRFPSCHIGIRFHCEDPILVAMDASNSFMVLDVVKREVTEWSRDIEGKRPKVPSPPGAWGGEGSSLPLCGAAFNPSEPSSMLLHNDSVFMYIAMQKVVPNSVAKSHSAMANGHCTEAPPPPVLPSPPPKKKQRKGAKRSEDNDKPHSKDMVEDEKKKKKGDSCGSNFTIVRGYSSVLLLDFVGGNELLVLENPWQGIRNRLPDTLDRKRFND
ncbi:unnamed protein product [Choristocarpus tenellus]